MQIIKKNNYFYLYLNKSEKNEKWHKKKNFS